MITTAAFVLLLPSQYDDAEGTDPELYEVSDGNTTNEYDNLTEVFSFINSAQSGTALTIIVHNDVSGFPGFTVTAGKDVTIRSSSDGPFTLTVATTNLRHFTVSGSLTLENIILDGNKPPGSTAGGNGIGGGIDVISTGALTMNDGSAVQNCYSSNGGGIYSAGMFTMNGGTISGNSAEQLGGGNGGGIYSAGTFTMNGGTISGNTSIWKGGGVYSTGSGASFSMNDGSISGNSAAGLGGGVHNDGASFTMYGGAISGNTAVNGGGGVNSTGGSFTMNGGKIYNNTVNNSYGIGGGVNSDYPNNIFVMNGGEIFGNTAKSGGGVASGGLFILDGDAKIFGNTAAAIGGGVLSSSATFNMNGGQISDNTAATNGGGVYNNASAAFTMTGGEITNNTGEGVFNNGFGAAVTMTGGKIINNKGSGVYNNGGLYDYSDKTTFTMTGGEISGNISTSWGGGVYNCNGKFTFENGEIYGNTATMNGGGVNSKGVFIMTGGQIYGNNASNFGGGVSNFGLFTLENGEIYNNSAKGSAGGVYNQSGNSYSIWFNMTGGQIYDNTALNGGGVCNDYTSGMVALYMTGGRIYNNTATESGGGVFGGNITMTGGEISGNTAAGGGGGVRIYTYATFTMSGDAVISNNTSSQGGGIYSDGMLVITGGTISGNTALVNGALGSGGAIYVWNYANITVKDGVVFTGNKAPTIREYTIHKGADFDNNKTADLTDYYNIGAVELDALFSGLNAPAFNNYDINYITEVKTMYVSIVPSGSGTLTVTENISNGIVCGILDEDGCIYSPTSVGMVGLLADTADGSEFVQLVIDNGSPFKSNSVKPVFFTDGMTVIVTFKDLMFTITVTADETSTINPGTNATVSAREDAKFTFSADHGYKVTAVYVDGVPISPEELASGEYTFFNVVDNHTISVVSEAVDEAGNGGEGGTGTEPGNGTGTGGEGGTGTGPNGGNGSGSAGTGGEGGTGTEPGNGTGTGGEGGTGTGQNGGNGSGSAGTGGEGGTGTGQNGGNGSGSAGNNSDGPGTGGNKGSEAGSSQSVTKDGEWSVLSLICVVIAIFSGMIALVAGMGRVRKYDEEKRSKTGVALRALALIISIVSVIVFFVTEYGNPIPVAVDTWTPLMFVLLLATLILAMISIRFDKADS